MSNTDINNDDINNDDNKNDDFRTDTKSSDYTNDNDNIEKPEKLKLFGILMQRGTAYYIVDITCLLLLISSFLFVALGISWDAYVWRFYVGFGCFMIFCLIISEINHHNKFSTMTAFFHRWRYPLIGIFFILSIIDFILLELSDVQSDCDFNDPILKENCPILNPDKNGVRYVTRFLTIICGGLFLCSLMGYWERVSYLSAHNSWVISILYMSIIGAIFLYFARCLEPPPTTEYDRKYKWSWHQTRSKNKIFRIIINIMIVIVLFFVIMGSIILSLFGDASRSSENLGTWAAIIIFIIIAHIIMITPLAPGSVVDVCAGFLFVSLFVNNEGLSIESSYFISLFLTILLHFSGSCAQYYVGKINSVQIWANKTLPPEMLAASDSVLKVANWFKVGVVGQVFMDTANGLNQGRMDMKFCTQFWSEYASIPNAIGLVSLGTILAIPSFGSDAIKNFQWAEDAIPLVIMITTLWQMIASSWGAKELLASSGTISYWTSLEKWCTIQYFYNKKGYVPTINGWNNDCYELGKTYFNIIQKYRKEDLENNPIYAEELKWLKKRDLRNCGLFCTELFSEPKNPGAQRKIIRHQKELEEKLTDLRQKHWNILEETKIDELLANGELLQMEKEVKIKNVFEDVDGVMFILHFFITLAIFITGVGSYVLIARNIELSEAVKEGIAVLGTTNVSIGGWREFKHDCIQLFESMGFICKGCKIEGIDNMETVYNPPIWINGPKEYNDLIENLNQTKSERNVIEEIDVNVDNK